jgi:hypothetical protein
MVFMETYRRDFLARLATYYPGQFLKKGARAREGRPPCRPTILFFVWFEIALFTGSILSSPQEVNFGGFGNQQKNGSVQKQGEHLTELYRVYAECLVLHYFFLNVGLAASNGVRARHSLYPVVYHQFRAIPASLARYKLLWAREAAQVLLRYTQFLSLLMQSGGVNFENQISIWLSQDE